MTHADPWDSPEGRTQSGVLLTMEEARKLLDWAKADLACERLTCVICRERLTMTMGLLRSKGVRLEDK